jgi:hypothetical protein
MSSNVSEVSGIYGRFFFEAQRHGAAQSADIIVPEILRQFPATRSVIDVGCGTGA